MKAPRPMLSLVTWLRHPHLHPCRGIVEICSHASGWDQLVAGLPKLVRQAHIAHGEQVLEVPPVRLHTVPGFESAVFAFTTDIPLLPRWGRPLLFGPGSILVAHTEDESIEIAEMEAAADTYVGLAKALLANGS